MSVPIEKKEEEKLVCRPGPRPGNIKSPLILLPDNLPGIYKYFGTDPRDSDKWIFPDAINALMKLGEMMREKGLEIGVGDISLEGGGPFFEYGSLKKLSHQTHKEGKDIDIRPIRKDRKRLPVTWKSSSYDMKSTHELIKLAKEVGFKWIYFNDPIIDANYEWVLSCRGHNNHLHLHY